MNDLSAVESIFLAAVEKPTPQDRVAYLDAACPDPQVRQHVERLLAAHPKVGSFLGNGGPSATVEHELISETPGTVVGPYKLMEQIGEGGMGLVFVAEQQQPVRRKVALKLIKPGMDTRQVVARFEAERQALALMDHPHIARVLDAGSTATGRPYFVMELVRGVPITEYCDTNNLIPRDRLTLFIQVCQAVQHAHQKGVIHRDLKPSNILVAPHDGVPVVKVIDFGVAKALGQQLTDKTIYTRFAQMIGTPLYMSPEQAEVNQLDVDTRSDIYSLGVLLYELLTGTTPFDRQRFQEAAFDEIRRIIKEEEPPKPSTRLTSLGATLGTVSAHRGTDPARLSKLVSGELDWIVMRCLEKDRTRRYDSAAGLAKDVQRYLADEPVEARPASLLYRLRKTYRRNRAALTIAGAFAAMLIVGFVLVTWKWQDERTARADADASRLDAERKTHELQQAAERMNAANAAMELAAQYSFTGQWVTAEAAHTRAIDLRPDHSQVWMRRAEFYGYMGLWDLAAADYARSIDLQPSEMVRHWYFHALLQLMQGNEAAYRRICRQMMNRFAASSEGVTRYDLVRACSLMPGAISDFERLLAPVSNKGVPSSVAWVPLHCHGLALFRAGQHEEAIRQFRDSLAKTEYHARAKNYPVLAMALYQSGQKDAARQELENCRQELIRWSTSAINNRARPVQWGYWYDWAELQVYYDEACRMIDPSLQSDDPRRRLLRAWGLAALGHVDNAAAEYAQSVRQAPEDELIRTESFRFHADAKRWAEADADLAALTRIRPKDANIHIQAFRAFAANDRWDRAVEQHGIAIKLKPDDFNLRFERFRFHAERGEPAEAEAAYAVAVKDRADDIPFRIKCGDACAAIGQWTKAREEYSKILDVGLLGDGDINRNAWLRLAVLQVIYGDLDGYRRTCKQLVAKHGDDPQNVHMLVRLCLLHAEPSVEPARVASLAQSIAKNGKLRDYDVHIVAFAAERAGDRSSDLTVLHRALEQNSWTTQIAAVALVYYHRGDHKTARQWLSRTSARHRKLIPQTAGGWELTAESQLWYRQAEALVQSERWTAAETLVKNRQWAAAIQAFEPLLKSDNKSANDWITRGDCYGVLGRWKEAMADFARADTLAPNHAMAALKHGSACLQVGDRDTYREVCRRVVERHATANDRTLLNNAAWLCALDPAAEVEAANALPLIDRALAKAPSNTFAHTRASVLYRMGRYDEALEQFNELLTQPGYPVNAWDWLFLAMTHHRLGRKEQARKYLDQSTAWIAANQNIDWYRRAELERFRAEAEALVGTKK